MRIAWIGPMPNETGGATGVATQLLLELANYNIEIDCFFPGSASQLPPSLTHLSNVNFYCQPSSWEWDRWYSRNRLMCFVTGQIANYRCEDRLAKRLLALHQERPYDLVYQFSHIELSILRKFVKQLPPIILHPSVHAAGELRWHRRETAISRQSESSFRRIGARLMLTMRSAIQRRHIRYPRHVISISKNFRDDLAVDYRVPAQKMTVIPNPIDTARFAPGPSVETHKRERLVFLFVSRIAVRKGVEMMVELSHRLDDISDRVQIQVIGDKSLWSDYTALLRQLNPNVAVFIGKVQGAGANMVDRYHCADALIQPSHYEPFGLTVGEALACGLPVITSDKVGAAEEVNPDCCRVFAMGNLDEMERRVRTLVQELQNPTRQRQLGELARHEAERLFHCSVVAADLVACFQRIAGHAPTYPSTHQQAQARMNIGV